MGEKNDQSKIVSDFYDKFSRSQVKTGINLRHFYLFNRLKKFGLKRNSSVLEIGCGIGTLTGLIAKYIKRGRMLVTDISPENIAIARRRLEGYPNLVFEVSDMSDFDAGRKFDFIVLADVIEHIPVDAHPGLFETLTRHMHSGSIVFIHVPHPKSIEYFEKNDRSKLQIIDQAIYANVLVSNAERCGMILHKYFAYSLFHKENDYVLATFGLAGAINFTSVPRLKIILRKMYHRIFFLIQTFF
jgi:trans-aconitate 2-methyltransferase